MSTVQPAAAPQGAGRAHCLAISFDQEPRTPESGVVLFNHSSLPLGVGGVGNTWPSLLNLREVVVVGVMPGKEEDDFLGYRTRDTDSTEGGCPNSPQ